MNAVTKSTTAATKWPTGDGGWCPTETAPNLIFWCVIATSMRDAAPAFLSAAPNDPDSLTQEYSDHDKSVGWHSNY